jgi:hypothetical protein
MKSNEQKRAELEARRAAKREAVARRARLDEAERRHDQFLAALARGELAVDRNRLAPSGSYGDPDFVLRGTYQPVPFVCKSCGKEEVWTPYQQKWWYEVALGDRFTTAKFCRPCRRKERERSARRGASISKAWRERRRRSRPEIAMSPLPLQPYPHQEHVADRPLIGLVRQINLVRRARLQHDVAIDVIFRLQAQALVDFAGRDADEFIGSVRSRQP